MFTAPVVAQVVVNGLVIGAMYVLVALGFTLIFGVMRTVNFAHGEFAMLGGFALFFLYGSLQLNFLTAVVLASTGTAVALLLAERVAFRPFYHKELQGLIATLGLSLALTYTAVILWGVEQRSVPVAIGTTLQVGGVFLPADRLVAMLIALTALAGYYSFMRFTKTGLAIRAAAQDFEVAQAQGANANRIYIIAFLIAALLAALAGGLWAQIYSLSPFTGAEPLLKAFIVVIIGGLGSVPGAAIGGIALGMMESVLDTYFGGAVSEFVAFGVIILILILRPQGLLGQEET